MRIDTPLAPLALGAAALAAAALAERAARAGARRAAAEEGVRPRVPARPTLWALVWGLGAAAVVILAAVLVVDVGNVFGVPISWAARLGVAAGIGLAVGAARLIGAYRSARLRRGRLAAAFGVGAIALSLLAGLAAVNVEFGRFRSLGQLSEAIIPPSPVAVSDAVVPGGGERTGTATPVASWTPPPGRPRAGRSSTSTSRARRRDSRPALPPSGCRPPRSSTTRRRCRS